MFTSLKNKIKEETGADVSMRQRPNNGSSIMRSRYPSTMSINSHAEAESEQLAGLTTKLEELQASLRQLQSEKLRVEKTNEILLESVRVAQTQKDLFCAEQAQAQAAHESEVKDLQALLATRESSANEQLARLQAELVGLRPLESLLQELRDEMERLRHTTQQEHNGMTTTLAFVQEENRHLRTRMQIIEEARIDALKTLSGEQKLAALVQERRLLEQRLEEAHSQLVDIKSTWSGQNLALETQVNRLSQQVAEETTEKRKACQARDDANERVKQLEFDVQALRELEARQNLKISAFEEELIEVNATLQEQQLDSEQKLQFEQNKVTTLESEIKELKTRLVAAEERFTDYAANAEQVGNKLRQQNAELQRELDDIKAQLASVQQQHATITERELAAQKNLLAKQTIIDELRQKQTLLAAELQSKTASTESLNERLLKLQEEIRNSEHKLAQHDELQELVNERNKTIKMLNQRLADLKKTLQKEFRGSSSSSSATAEPTAIELLINSAPESHESTGTCHNDYPATITPNGSGAGGSIVMDEVNFKYLKHVIVKFLTSREVEARHLIRAVATLLQLSAEEEKLLHDTLNWKMSWFGSKPDHGRGQLTTSMPPS